MSDNQKNSSEKTDLNEVFQKAKEQVQNGQNASTAEKTKFKLNDKQKAAAILGTVLLGGTAFVAVDQVNGQVVEPQVTPTDSTQVHTAESVSIDSSAASQQIAVGETQSVTGGTICPNEDIQIASDVTDSMSFSEAFAAAREEVGPGGVFTWHGTTYNTFFKEEWNQLGLADKQEFLHNIGYQLEVPDTVDSNNVHHVEAPDGSDSDNNQEHAGAPDAGDGNNNQEPPVNNGPVMDWESADIKEIMIDGKVAYVLDANKDGIADAIMMPDAENNQTVVFLDESGDGSLDTVFLMDSNMQPIASEPMDEPMELLMANVGVQSENNDNDDVIIDETEAQAFENAVEEELEEDGEIDNDESISMSGDYTNHDDVEDIAS